MADWDVLVEPGAFDEWITRATPPLTVQAAVAVWLAELESLGPPAITEYTAAGLPVAEVADDAHVVFAVLSAPLGTGPPFGIIAIRRIL